MLNIPEVVAEYTGIILIVYEGFDVDRPQAPI